MASAVPRLHRAAARGEHWKVKQYVNAGDAVNARDEYGQTALLHAVCGDHNSCIKILLTAGADPSLSNNGQVFPLYIAAKTGNITLARALIEAKADVKAIVDQPDAGTALWVAAFNGHNKAMIKLLLDAGCDTSITAAGGHHPLTTAAREGHIDIVSMLLDSGADVNAISTEGRTALTGGALSGSCDVVRKLLEWGAHVNQPGALDGRTALHMAAESGFDEVISVLIAGGADVDTVDHEQKTPLHISAFGGAKNVRRSSFVQAQMYRPEVTRD